MNWREQAACRGQGAMTFYSHSEAEPKEQQYAKERAREVIKANCAQCPVRRECLEYAVTHGEIHGIWGGMTETERHEYVKSVKMT